MAVDELLYDPSVIEGNPACSPACLNEGICQNTICFCLSPYGGDYCQTDLGVTARIDVLLFIVMIIGGLALGFVLVFVVKFIWDWIFIKEIKPLKTDKDKWKP